MPGCRFITRPRRCGFGENLNVEVLEKALNVIIARHEILRTTIQASRR